MLQTPELTIRQRRIFAARIPKAKLAQCDYRQFRPPIVVLIALTAQERRPFPSVNRGEIQHGGESHFVSKGRIVHARNICISDGSDDFDEADFFESLTLPLAAQYSRRSTSPIASQTYQAEGYVMAWFHFTLNLIHTDCILGIEREYEFVDCVPKVVALHDGDTQTSTSDDEWEPVYMNRDAFVGRKPCSFVVAGG